MILPPESLELEGNCQILDFIMNSNSNNSGDALPPAQSPVRSPHRVHEVDVAPEEQLGARRVLPYTIAILAMSLILQIHSNAKNRPGPIDELAEYLIPRFANAGIGSFRQLDDVICPPGPWLDSAFDEAPGQKGELYSRKFDPRMDISHPSLFPHCALRKWVNFHPSQSCPEGYEYTTIINPPTTTTTKNDSGIPNIVHLLSPSNCLPSKTVRVLTKLTDDANLQPITVYVHSNTTMDNFIYLKEWNVFPDAKEGLICGVAKLNTVLRSTMDEIGMKDGRQKLLDEVSLGVKLDIWRLLVLWEFGGVTLDVSTLDSILYQPEEIAGNSTSSSKGYSDLAALVREWTTSSDDALLYWINNEERQRSPWKERIPFTDVIGSAPNHPLIYYAAKFVLKIANWDSDKSISDLGRTTAVKPIQDSLTQLLRQEWKNVKIGDVATITSSTKDSRTIRFLNGDQAFPSELTYPPSSWRSMLQPFMEKVRKDRLTYKRGKEINEISLQGIMKKYADRQTYIEIDSPFSCMEYKLNMHLTEKTSRRETVECISTNENFCSS